MRIKRQYAKAAKAAKAGKTVATTTKAAAATVKSAAITAKLVAIKVKALAALKAIIAVGWKVILAIILIVILLVLIVSCVSMIGGGFAAIMDGLSYQADMDDITEYSVYIVTAAEDMGGYGLTVIIEHIDDETGIGVRVLYAHLYQIDVAVGDVLELGDIIGLVGQTGTATGPHLHLEIFISDDSGATWRRINPKFFVEPFPPEPD